MDDIFYMSSKKININDINDLAKRAKAKNSFLVDSSKTLEIEYCDGVIATWFDMSIECFEELEDKKFLIENKIETIYCISYHSRDFKQILLHIKLLLQKHGGWIGSDEYGFRPYFTLQTIDYFK